MNFGQRYDVTVIHMIGQMIVKVKLAARTRNEIKKSHPCGFIFIYSHIDRCLFLITYRMIKNIKMSFTRLCHDNPLHILHTNGRGNKISRSFFATSGRKQGLNAKINKNKFAKLSKARRDHWSLIIEDHKSLIRLDHFKKKIKLKKFKVKKFLSKEISMSEKV